MTTSQELEDTQESQPVVGYYNSNGEFYPVAWESRRRIRNKASAKKAKPQHRSLSMGFVLGILVATLLHRIDPAGNMMPILMIFTVSFAMWLVFSERSK